MAAIPINEETIKRFEHESFSPNPESSPEPGPTNEEATQQLNEAVGWLLKTADSALANVDERLATDQNTIDRVSELSVLVAKRNISEDILRNSPELFLGTIVTGLAIEKWIIFNKIQKEQAKAEPKQESQDEAQAENE